MSSGCETPVIKPSNPTGSALKIDFLFLDESVCKPCSGTAQALSEAVEMLTEPLRSIGVGMEVTKIHIADQDIAESQRFLSSPTIRVNGNDIDPARTEGNCPTCGNLAGGTTSVTCRNWHWHDEVYPAAPVGKIVEAIMEVALSPSNKSTEGCCNEDCCHDDGGDGNYMLPENLKGFFAARKRNEKLCC